MAKSYEFEVRIDDLIVRHKALKRELGTQRKNKAWAVWLQLGAMIALCKQAIKNRDNDSELMNFFIMRLMYEYSLQINFFAHPSVKVQAVKDWWKPYNPLAVQYTSQLDDIEYRLFAKDFTRKKIAEKYIRQIKGSDESNNDIFTVDPNSKDIISMLSLYAHPSNNMTRYLFQSDKNNAKYEMYEFYGGSIEASTSIGMIIKIAEETMGHVENRWFDLNRSR